MLVPASVDGRVAVFLVPTNAAGLTSTRQQTMNHEPVFEVTLDNVRVGDDAVLGSLEQGSDILAWTLNRATVALCALMSGVGEQAVRLTAQYTCDRKQFDRAIGTFQAVGQRMADCFIDMQGMELTMLQAATHLDEGRDDPLEVATAKFWAAEGGDRIAHTALHVHGGISIDVDFPIHRYFLWLKQYEFTLGSATPELLKIGKELATPPSKGVSELGRRGGKMTVEESSGADVIAASFERPAAFGGIFDRHATSLHRYFVRRLGPFDAEALVGDVFRIAFEKRQTYDLARPNAALVARHRDQPPGAAPARGRAPHPRGRAPRVPARAGGRSRRRGERRGRRSIALAARRRRGRDAAAARARRVDASRVGRAELRGRRRSARRTGGDGPSRLHRASRVPNCGPYEQPTNTEDRLRPDRINPDPEPGSVLPSEGQFVYTITTTTRHRPSAGQTSIRASRTR
jgi:hypothetical protein